MRFLDPADFVAMPWKNGGGSTLQLAIHPPGATLDSFEWRLSLATVGRSGPFSSFPGCRRTLMLVEGDGFELDVDGRRVVLDRPLEPVTFDGAARVECRLRGGPSRDLGLITRGCSGELSARRLDGAQRIEATLLVCLDGRIEIGGRTIEGLGLVYLDPGPVDVTGKGTLALVRLRQGTGR